MSISRKSSLIFLSFLFLIILYRFLLPYGDEPDFGFRMRGVLFNEHPIFSPYFYFQNLLLQYNWILEENFFQKVIRIVATIIAVMPILLILIFKNLFIKLITKFNKKITVFEWNTRIDALGLTLLFPSILFYLGVFAEEQFTLILSIFIFIFWRFPFIVSLLFFAIAYIDIGNALVILFFLLLVFYFKLINKKFSFKIMILNMLFFVIISYLMGINLVTYIEYLPIIGDKASIIYEHYTTIYTEVATKYPAFFRPMITILTGIFWLPSNFLTFYLYPLYFLFLFLMIKKSIMMINNKYKDFTEEDNIIVFLSVITTIFIIPLILNGYATAKYYVFMLPFILLVALRFYKFKSIFYFLIISNILILLQLSTLKI